MHGNQKVSATLQGALFLEQNGLLFWSIMKNGGNVDKKYFWIVLSH